ncbi:hypothetical protein [Paenibacillus sp. GXUN7292]|uniref:hypothetical protein n=1 Tax=Paenibacillus sp. GXUN7292 TaxID=3422499 RepID=UPI003D7EAB1E
MTNRWRNNLELCEVSEASIIMSDSVSSRGRHAVRILTEEIERRTGIRVPVSDSVPVDQRPIISITMIHSQVSPGGSTYSTSPAYGQEGYRIQISHSSTRRLIEIESADDRGMLLVLESC